MPNFDPLLNILHSDLEALSVVVVGTAVMSIIPAGVVSLIAAAKTEPTRWRDWPIGAFWGWLAGTAAWTVSLPVISGVAIIGEQMVGIRVLQTNGTWSWAVILGCSFLLSAVAGYRMAVRYFKWKIKDRLGWKIDDPAPQPANRWYSFSLRNLLLVQVVAVIVFGLWVGSRRQDIDNRYWQASVRERFCPHGWDTKYPYRPLHLSCQGNALIDFQDQVLDKFQSADELGYLEVNSDQLTDEGLRLLARNAKLTTLRIHSKQITNAGIAHLTQITSLERLQLHCELLTHDSLVELRKIKSLRNVTMYSKRMSPAAVTEFKQARPEVTLYVFTH